MSSWARCAASLTITAGDAAGHTLTYSAGGLPAGLSINSGTGVISETISAGAAVSSPYTVAVSASDGTISSSQTFTWAVTPVVTVTNPGNQSSVEGNTVSLQIQASDARGLTLTYSASGLPGGLGISTSGLISGQVTVGDSNSSPYAVTVTASDGTYTGMQTFVWTVTHSNNQPPVVTNPGSQGDREGDLVSLQIVATDSDSDPLIYTATGLPDGLVIDPFSGLISGTMANNTAANGPYTVTVSADDRNGGVTSQTFTWMVNDAALSAQTNPISATEATFASNLAVATFTDANPNRPAQDFTATINWGDGTSDSGSISGSGGSFSVTGSHMYTRAASFTVTVIVSDVEGANASASNTASVSAVALSAQGVDVNAVRGTALNNVPVAWFTDANPNDLANTYRATIDWGDNTGTSPGTITGSLGTFTVAGTHTYAMHGTYCVDVTITDQDGTSTMSMSIAIIGDVLEARQDGLTAATFTDTDPTSTPASFSATINWGDNSSSSGTITGGSGQFTVSGSHSYTGTGQYDVNVVISKLSTGYSVSMTGELVVAHAALAAYNGLIPATAGSPTPNVPAAVFTDADPTELASAFSAQINWGDGSAPTITTNITGSAGLFSVMGGGHTYAVTGLYQLVIVVLGPAGPVPADTVGLMPGEADVAAAPPTVRGPSVVPAFSRYYFRVDFDKPVPASKVQILGWFVTDLNLATVLNSESRLAPSGTDPSQAAGILGRLEFKNTAGKVKVWAKYKVNGRQYVSAPLPVSVVQVVVRPAAGDFQAQAPFDVGTNPQNETIDGRVQNVMVKQVRPRAPGLKWRASVVLNGPTGDNESLKQITVGFVQHVTHLRLRSHFPTVKKYVVFDKEGRKYLDGNPRLPSLWYDEAFNRRDNLPVILSGASGTIGSRDTPKDIFVVSYPNPADNADEVAGRAMFTLDVAAITNVRDRNLVDGDNNPDYWKQYTAPWSVDTSGTIRFVAADNTYRWAAARGAAVVPPQGWIAAKSIQRENYDDTNANNTKSANVETTWTSVNA